MAVILQSVGTSGTGGIKKLCIHLNMHTKKRTITLGKGSNGHPTWVYIDWCHVAHKEWNL